MKNFGNLCFLLALISLVVLVGYWGYFREYERYEELKILTIGKQSIGSSKEAEVVMFYYFTTYEYGQRRIFKVKEDVRNQLKLDKSYVFKFTYRSGDIIKTEIQEEK